MVILPIIIYNNKFGSDKVRDSYSFKRFRRIVLLKLKDTRFLVEQKGNRQSCPSAFRSGTKGLQIASEALLLLPVSRVLKALWKAHLSLPLPWARPVIYNAQQGALCWISFFSSVSSSSSSVSLKCEDSQGSIDLCGKGNIETSHTPSSARV